MAATVDNLISYPPPAELDTVTGVQEEQVPSSWPYILPQEAESLRIAVATRQMSKVRTILSEYSANHSRASLGIFSDSLDTAVRTHQPEILVWLLSAGLPVESLSIDAALTAKSAAIFQIYIDFGWDVNKPSSRINPPPLAFVVEDQNLTRWFLDHGADPNARCDWDITPMSYAVSRASISTIKLLMERGGNVKKGQLLHWAVDRDDADALEVLRLLLQLGVPINDIQYKNDPVSWIENKVIGLGTPLHAAAQQGKLESVAFLLENGADYTIKDTRERTARDLARTKGHLTIVELLQEYEAKYMS